MIKQSNFSRYLAESIAVHNAIMSLENHLNEVLLSGDFHKAVEVVNENLQFYDQIASHASDNEHFYPNA